VVQHNSEPPTYCLLNCRIVR